MINFTVFSYIHSNVYEGIVVFVGETGWKENDEPLRCGRVNSGCIFENWRRRQNRPEPNLGARSCPRVCSPTVLRPRSGQFCPSKRDNGWSRFDRVLKSLCSRPKMKTTINSCFCTIFNFIHFFKANVVLQTKRKAHNVVGCCLKHDLMLMESGCQKLALPLSTRDTQWIF